MIEEIQTKKNTGTNNYASSSLLFGIFSIFFPFFGLIFGVFGILFAIRARKELAVSGEAGKFRAIAGFICSVTGLLMQYFMVSWQAIFTYFGIQLNIFY